MSTGLKFGDPPPQRGTAYDWTSIAADLKANPGQWAKVFDNDRYSLVSAVQYGGIAVFREPGFKVRTENNHTENGRRQCALWMSYEKPKRKRT